MFTLESSAELPLPQKNSKILVFKHTTLSFRIAFAEVQGPLCTGTIVVPTASEDDRGLPHTLETEHLIFCGSKRFPIKGYLDSLVGVVILIILTSLMFRKANRCLSTGTNAYTTEDHTGYTISTAGSEGLINILPGWRIHIEF
ncbi:hypothetical protein HK096_001651 [Nowakowskiella sp. JEL0078]|nr:hypothetical protein HK096_001651 [Nowakowskiella sp. JEL0078]